MVTQLAGPKDTTALHDRPSGVVSQVRTVPRIHAPSTRISTGVGGTRLIKVLALAGDERTVQVWQGVEASVAEPQGFPGHALAGRGPGDPFLLPERLAPRRTGHVAGMFLFFSNRLGCLGSLMLSVIVSTVLVLLLWR